MFQLRRSSEPMKIWLFLWVALMFGCSTPPPVHHHVKRSHAAITAFKHQHPCPVTGQPKGPCPGYVIDHVIALACGGKDAPSNMQWQTIEEGKAKDKWERIGCN